MVVGEKVFVVVLRNYDWIGFGGPEIRDAGVLTVKAIHDFSATTQWLDFEENDAWAWSYECRTLSQMRDHIARRKQEIADELTALEKVFNAQTINSEDAAFVKKMTSLGQRVLDI
jgi:hypothetical protein